MFMVNAEQQEVKVTNLLWNMLESNETPVFLSDQ